MTANAVLSWGAFFRSDQVSCGRGQMLSGQGSAQVHSTVERQGQMVLNVRKQLHYHLKSVAQAPENHCSYHCSLASPVKFYKLD